MKPKSLRLALAAFSVAAVAMGVSGLPAWPAAADDAALRTAIASPKRTARYTARDVWRHPYEVLTFFGLRPDMTVVEIWPGRRGWWTEILVPYLKNGRGTYVPIANSNPKKKIRSEQAGTDRLVVADFKADVDLAPPGTADMVLTFRNLHNWMKRGVADNAFRAFYKALKPGGILGVVDHRAKTDKPQDPLARDGYVREDYAIALAEKAGFSFVGISEINANPRDTRDHPAGVWTLAPSFRLKDKDRAKYEAIGESDRFTLKFMKPTK
jgi:predicted methyltransferase